MDVSRLARLGWRPQIDLRHGLEQTYRWYLDQVGNLRG
jgi:nucleoside-diphosphate-sugar epimerase